MSGSYADVGTHVVRRHHHYDSSSPAQPRMQVGGATLDAATAFLRTPTTLSRKNLILGAVVAVLLGAVGSAVALMPPGDD